MDEEERGRLQFFDQKLSMLRSHQAALEDGTDANYLRLAESHRLRLDARIESGRRILLAAQESLRRQFEVEEAQWNLEYTTDLRAYRDTQLADVGEKIRLVMDEKGQYMALREGAAALADAAEPPEAAEDNPMSVPLPAPVSAAAGRTRRKKQGGSTTSLNNETGRARITAASPVVVELLDNDLIVQDVRLISDGVSSSARLGELLQSAFQA